MIFQSTFQSYYLQYYYNELFFQEQTNRIYNELSLLQEQINRREEQERNSIRASLIQYVNSPKRLEKWLQDETHTIEDFYELYG